MTFQQLLTSRASLDRLLKSINVLTGTAHLREDIDVTDKNCGERLFENRYSFAADRGHAIEALREVRALIPEFAAILTDLYDHRDTVLARAFGRGQVGDDFRAIYQEIKREQEAELDRQREEAKREKQASILEQQQAAAARGEVFCPHCKTVMSGAYCDCD